MDNRLRTLASRIIQRLVESRRYRAILFLATLIYIFFFFGFITVGTDWLDGEIILYLAFLFFFPWGLIVFLFAILSLPPSDWSSVIRTDNDREFLLGVVIPSVIGWLIYIVVARVGIITSQRRVFILSYIVFIVLLIANIAGCQISFSH